MLNKDKTNKYKYKEEIITKLRNYRRYFQCKVTLLRKNLKEMNNLGLGDEFLPAVPDFYYKPNTTKITGLLTKAKSKGRRLFGKR